MALLRDQAGEDQTMQVVGQRRGRDAQPVLNLTHR